MLLALKTRKRGEWLTIRQNALQRLDELEELGAEIWTQFRTEGNELSVFEVDASLTRVPRIAAAILASGNGKLDHTDCLVFDAECVTAVGLRLQRSDGQTIDLLANTWHWDVVDISACKMAELAELLVLYGQMEPCTKSDLQAAVRDALDKQEIRAEKATSLVRQLQP